MNRFDRRGGGCVRSAPWIAIPTCEFSGIRTLQAMDTKTAIRERRAIKHYDPQFKMTEVEEKELPVWPKPGHLPYDKVVIENRF